MALKGNELEFNMSDAELLQQLQTVELTEEESEEMLREAYRVNRKLKKILQLQEESMKHRTTSASGGSTVSNATGQPQSAKLPPISKREVGFTHAYSKKLGDQHPNRKPGSRSGKMKPA